MLSPEPAAAGARRPSAEPEALSLGERLRLWSAVQIVCLVAQAAELLARQAPPSRARTRRSDR